jgi:hypothetical protein
MAENYIREPDVERDEQENIKHVAISFGPHYFVEIMPDEKGVLTLYLGATHHGFSAKADEVNGQLERIVEEVMKSHPDLSF